MQIEEYGLQWNIKSVDNVGHVLLKQGSGLVFRGRLEVHPFWGPYIQVNTAIAQKILTGLSSPNVSILNN